MSSTTNAKTRSERAANLRVDRYPWRSLFERITTLDALARLGLAIAAAAATALCPRLRLSPPQRYVRDFAPALYDAARLDAMQRTLSGVGRGSAPTV